MDPGSPPPGCLLSPLGTPDDGKLRGRFASAAWMPWTARGQPPSSIGLIHGSPMTLPWIMARAIEVRKSIVTTCTSVLPPPRSSAKARLRRDRPSERRWHPPPGAPRSSSRPRRPSRSTRASHLSDDLDLRVLRREPCLEGIVSLACDPGIVRTVVQMKPTLPRPLSASRADFGGGVSMSAASSVTTPSCSIPNLNPSARCSGTGRSRPASTAGAYRRGGGRVSDLREHDVRLERQDRGDVHVGVGRRGRQVRHGYDVNASLVEHVLSTRRHGTLDA